MLIRMYMDFNRDQPTGKLFSAMVNSWAGHLANVGAGVEQVTEIYDKVVQTKGSERDSYLPNVSDLVAAWREMVDAGYWDRQNESAREEYAALPSPPPNTKSLGFRVFKMSEKRTRAGLDTVCCDCTCDYGYGIPAKLTDDGKYFCCGNGVCDFREPVEKLMEIRCHPTYEPAGNLRHTKSAETMHTPESTALNKTDILKALKKRCRVDLRRIERDKAVAFGQFMLDSHLPLAAWNHDVAKVFWQAFVGMGT